MNKEIRKAYCSEAGELTEIAFAAKRTWPYPDAYFEEWKSELTISESYIDTNIVYVATTGGRIAGFYSIVEVPEDFYTGRVFVKKGYWLEHLFITPAFQHKGFGKCLIEHALLYCQERGIGVLKIFVDPNASGFYEKMGGLFIENSPSSIEGREIPVFQFKIL